ncbi:MAG: hypothetical protein KHZ29_00025 [Desulfovibrionaceae bacterium]|nr:hypothetical protein [Desulfovibrionaceae bacterium]
MALVLKEMMKKEKYYAWIRSINQWSSERSELGATTPLSLTAGGTRVSAFGATTPRCVEHGLPLSGFALQIQDAFFAGLRVVPTVLSPPFFPHLGTRFA